MTKDEALVRLVNGLKTRDYRFTTVTPSTHAQILARPNPDRPTLRDIFGWNRPFEKAALDPQLLDWLQNIGMRRRCLPGTCAVSFGFRAGRRPLPSFVLSDRRFERSIFRSRYLPVRSLHSNRKFPKLGPKSWIVDLGRGFRSWRDRCFKAVARCKAHALWTLIRSPARLSELNCKASGVTAEIAVSPTFAQGMRPHHREPALYDR